MATVGAEYVAQYKTRHAASSTRYTRYRIEHLTKLRGPKMLIEITDAAVITYQQARLEQGAAAKTINEEVGVLFRLMGSYGKAVHDKLKDSKTLKLAQPEDIGR